MPVRRMHHSWTLAETLNLQFDRARIILCQVGELN